MKNIIENAKKQNRMRKMSLLKNVLFAEQIRLTALLLQLIKGAVIFMAQGSFVNLAIMRYTPRKKVNEASA